MMNINKQTKRNIQFLKCKKENVMTECVNISEQYGCLIHKNIFTKRTKIKNVLLLTELLTRNPQNETHNLKFIYFIHTLHFIQLVSNPFKYNNKS